MHTTQLLRLMVSSLCACGASVQAQEPPKEPPAGWSGLLINHVTLQKSTEEALRNRPSPFRPPLVTNTGGRLLNFLVLRLKHGDWMFHGAYSDNRTLGGGSAYSLTNPMGFGVNTVETIGVHRRSVDDKSGLQELAITHRQNGTMVMLGKIDTANWYLSNPLFSGDLVHGNDYGNAATRVVAPPFPSWALVVQQNYSHGLSFTGIVGDAFGDRETIHAARNLVHGDLAYVLELNFRHQQQHYQLTFNHTDAFRFYDKDAVWPGPGHKAPKVDAVIATASYRFNPHWSGFGRVGYSKGDAQIEDRNYLIGIRYDMGRFYALGSQSATRVASNNLPYQRGAKGDITLVSEITLNYKVHPQIVVGMTYDKYQSNGNALLAKDGGWNGAKRNHVVGLRVTSFLPF